MTSLLETITDKAEKSFGQPVTKTNFNQWCEHWIKTGLAWREELATQNLIQTCSKIDDLIEFERDMLDRRRQYHHQYLRFPLECNGGCLVFYDLGHEIVSYWMVPGTEMKDD